MARTANLTAKEQRLWRAWLELSERVAARIARDVAEASGVSAAEYGVLERLVALGAGRMRQRDLALALDWDKSRISHQLTRMQERGLLTRSKTAQAGSQVIVSARGREALDRARPLHARAVRRHLLEHLTAEHAAAVLALSDF